jgi:DNA-binding NarL/FixJ family response regulator
MSGVGQPLRRTIMPQLRILLADDHTIVRQGLRRVLEEQTHWRVVAEAGDGREAVRLAEEHKPDVAIIDVAMPLLNGIETTRQIVRRVPGARVLVLSMYAEPAYVTQMLDAGAGGYLLKDSADVDLFEAVSAVADGRTFFSPAVARLMATEPRPRGDSGLDRYDTLSAREREIFQLVAECRTNKDIAAMLSISLSTVETHRARIMEKLDLHSAAEIALYAVRRGVIR